ncbi:hypothetical protein MNEG_10117 [Monoraphidium neglectum]|uniref:Uncharacterized protein n=1 Tax=Monoraphidium neglectum TaxID=145388 RepID=A0A0D2KQE2_9CHLO|nr:hypothetical protein MNEG_10117 [Monoraphidium neglectum]KIY97843.1 hypothetical protein MNEG_10117 [Monoraphidium neglectum]|eukprot:XP_013896863.1 hypothetical protein MNEG_10117 [Monoraphidium neglectum]
MLLLKVQQQGERRREEGLAAKLRAAQLLDARRAARHAREAALDAARRREWRAARLAAVVRATSKLAAGLAAARQLRAARARMQHAEEAVVVIQKCWRGYWQRKAFLRAKRAAVALQRGYRRHLANGSGSEAGRSAAAALLVQFLCDTQGLHHLAIAVRRLRQTVHARKQSSGPLG